MHRYGIKCGIAIKRRATGQRKKHDATERIEIGLLVDWSTACLLRAHVQRRADYFPSYGQAMRFLVRYVDALGNAEI